MVGGMDKTVLLLWRSHNHDQVVHAPIVHDAVAVADPDETYGAQAAAEKNTFTNTNNSANIANYANYTYYGPPKLYSITVAFQSQK